MLLKDQSLGAGKLALPGIPRRGYRRGVVVLMITMSYRYLKKYYGRAPVSFLPGCSISDRRLRFCELFTPSLVKYPHRVRL